MPISGNKFKLNKSSNDRHIDNIHVHKIFFSRAAAPAASAGPSEADMRKLTAMVLDECSKQISDATGKQQGKIDELNSEIRLNMFM